MERLQALFEGGSREEAIARLRTVAGPAAEQEAPLRLLELHDVDLRGADLSGLDLRGLHLWSADLRGADLRGSDLRGAMFWGGKWAGVKLAWARVAGSGVSGWDWESAAGEAQRRQLKEIRRLLRWRDWPTVREGLERAASSTDPVIIEVLARGLVHRRWTPATHYQLYVGDNTEIAQCVRPEYRSRAALLVLQMAGLFDIHPQLGVRLDGWSRADLSILSGLTSLRKLALSLGGSSAPSPLTDLSALAPLARLRGLSLWGCRSVTDISQVGALTALESLTLDLTGIVDLAPIASLPALTELRLRNCSAVHELTVLGQIPTLRALSLQGCDPDLDLSPLAELSELTELELSGLPKTPPVSVLQDLTSLERLSFNNCPNLRAFTGLPGLSSLRWLSISSCGELRDISGLSHHPSLAFLRVSGDSFLRDFSALSDVTALQRLFLSGCSGLRALPDLSRLTALREADMSFCDQLTDISGLRALPSLQRLRLDAERLIDVSPLSGLSALRELSLWGCRRIEDFSALAGLSSLRELNLRKCRNFRDLSVLSGLSSLRRLELEQCGVTDLSPLAALSSVTELDLRSCGELADLSGLRALTSLRTLNLSLDWAEVEWEAGGEGRDLSSLAALTDLETLDVSGSANSGPFSFLSALTSLQALDLCESTIADLSPLSALPSVASLNLGRCRGLSDLSPLATVTTLRHLDLTGCEGIRDLSPLLALGKRVEVQTEDISAAAVRAFEAARGAQTAAAVVHEPERVRALFRVLLQDAVFSGFVGLSAPSGGRGAVSFGEEENTVETIAGSGSATVGLWQSRRLNTAAVVRVGAVVTLLAPSLVDYVRALVSENEAGVGGAELEERAEDLYEALEDHYTDLDLEETDLTALLRQHLHGVRQQVEAAVGPWVSIGQPNAALREAFERAFSRA